MTPVQPPARPLIEVEALTKDFASKAGPPARVVDGASFSVAGGQIVALLGGNGAGKTTTLGMILGLITPTAGRVLLQGVDVARAGPDARAAMNFQSPYVDLPKRLSVRQNLTVYAKLYGAPRPRERIVEVAAELDLEGLLDQRAGTLSAGQSTRLGLAKALINQPKILLLDEPTASLDPDTADWVRTAIDAYRRRTGAAVLLASHNMGEVERLADRVLMMKAGRIVDDATPRALIDKYGRANLEEVFLDVARGQNAATPAPAPENAT